MSAGQGGKRAPGVLVSAVGVMIPTGTDRRVEVLVLDHVPMWFNNLSTMI